MISVGLTGNIGSGKSVVARIFSKLGVPVFYADIEAGKLYEVEEIKVQVIKIFGKDVVSPSGEIIKPALAQIVFSIPDMLEKLNNIIHPAVRQNYQYWKLQHQELAYTLYEAAILFESGHYLEMDRVICVTAPKELRIRRVMARDHVTRQDVERRIENQWPEERKVKLSDFVIKNDESEGIIEQVLKVHRVLSGKEDRTGGL